MSEPFPIFSNNFRVFLSSLLAFASSGIFAVVTIAQKVNNNFDCLSKLLLFGSFLFFVSTILITMLISFCSLQKEVREGMTTSKELDPRNMNLKKFSYIKYPFLSFIFGAVIFSIFFIKALFGA